MTYDDYQSAWARWHTQLTDLAKRSAAYDLRADGEDPAHYAEGFSVDQIGYAPDVVNVEYQVWDDMGEERYYLVRVPPAALDADDAWRQCVVAGLAKDEAWAALAAEDLDVLL